MAEQQLWLFAEPKPLRERLGNEFFSKAPRCPGVYIMADRHGRVLYVGQSKNLRQRLNTYKNLRPGKDPRRLVRLAQAVATITWEECPDPPSARLRENELLRLHRPKFNSVNTHPEAYGFIRLRATEQNLELWLTPDATPEDGLYGAFKGVRISGYGALIRLLLWTASDAESPEAFPLRLLSARPPRRFQVRLNSRATGWDLNPVVESMHQFLGGNSDELLDRFRALLPVPPSLPPFWQTLLEADLEAAEDFYQRGPRRNHDLQERHGLPGRLIRPAELDDLLVKRDYAMG